MRFHSAFPIIILVGSLLIPAEAGILAWIGGKLWFINPLNLMPSYIRGNSIRTSNSFVTNDNSGTSTFNFGTGNSIINDGNVIQMQGVTIGSYSNSKGNFATTFVDDMVGNGLVFRGGQIISGAFITSNYNSVFKVRIRQYMGKDGECEEEIMIVWLDKTTGRTLYTKCLGYGKSRRLKNDGDLVLIGNPNENFCAFTTNKNEIFYLANGKWKKGTLNGDSKKDKELTSTEVSRVKDRIKKWDEFFNKIKMEILRIKGLKENEKIKCNKKKDELKGLREQANQKHKVIVGNIKKLRENEKAKHRVEMQKINQIKKSEGWSSRVDKMEDIEDKREANEENRLDRMEDDEDKRYDAEDNRYDAMIDDEDNKYDAEERRLERLEDEVEEKASLELKRLIRQGW